MVSNPASKVNNVKHEVDMETVNDVMRDEFPVQQKLSSIESCLILRTVILMILSEIRI